MINISYCWKLYYTFFCSTGGFSIITQHLKWWLLSPQSLQSEFLPGSKWPRSCFETIMMLHPIIYCPNQSGWLWPLTFVSLPFTRPYYNNKTEKKSKQQPSAIYCTFLPQTPACLLTTSTCACGCNAFPYCLTAAFSYC